MSNKLYFVLLLNTHIYIWFFTRGILLQEKKKERKEGRLVQCTCALRLVEIIDAYLNFNGSNAYWTQVNSLYNNQFWVNLCQKIYIFGLIIKYKEWILGSLLGKYIYNIRFFTRKKKKSILRGMLHKKERFFFP